MPLIWLDLLHTLNETFLIRDNFNFHAVNFPFICSHIPAASADGAYVSQLKHCSASSGSPSFCYPLSKLGHEWTLICLVCTDCMSFHLSSLMTCHHVWHMTVVGVSSIMHSNCGTGPYLPSWAFVSKSSFNGIPVAQTLVSNEDHCFPFVLSLSLTFVLRYVGSGYTYVVFRLSLCVLGLKLSLYLVCILYFVVICILIRLHQSKKAHSTTYQALLNCKYEIISIFPCCSL
jgi:hypothetical protein